MPRVRWAGPVALVLAGVFVQAGSPAKAATKIPVVAAEGFWGSLARELGGEHVNVKSIVDDPETHAHDYEPKPSDGVAVATAKVAIVNGAGYDAWAADLLEANPSSGRKVVNVGDVVGVDEGGNPHQWYSPRSVDRVIDAITDAFKQAAPTNAAYFDTQRQVYRVEKLKRYNELRSEIKAQFDGTAVGATESIFAPMADDLGLKVLTPSSFQDAVAEGGDPTAADKATVDQQITGKQIKVLIYNSQNSTPDVAALLDKAEKVGIPVTTVTETPNPKGTAFQDWQANQLQSLANALARATGKPAAPAPAPPVSPSAAPQASTSGPSPARQSAETDAGRSAAAASASEATASTLARTGTATKWLLPMAGTALAIGGLGVMGGSARRRARSPMRSA